jgi:cytochrome c-type biogenesis protein CcmH/NrfG
MNRESLAMGVAGVLFGLLAGWIIGSQRADVRPLPADRMTQQAPAPAESPSSQPAPLDQRRVDALRAEANQRAEDPGPRVQLGNMYFDAEQFSEAIKWYQEALALNPRDPNVSTDLGVSYYYSDQPDKALQQFERSLEMDPNHVKTILNMGIVRAFGKRDLEGAAAAWEKVMKIAPDSPEGRAAKQALDAMRASHPAPGPAGG